MDKILFILITCTREESRQLALNLCVDSIVNNFPSEILDTNFIVFDNGSTIEETHSLLKNTFKNVIFSKENVGLWSGVTHCLENYRQVLNREFDFVFPIESDNFLYEVERLSTCTQFLEKFEDIAMIRLKEFDVNQIHKFDKSRGLKQRSEITLKNLVTNEKAFFEKSDDDDDIFVTNLHPILPAIHRIDLLRNVMHDLASLTNFDEKDFWESYQKISNNKKNALLNRGLYYEVVFEHEILTSVNNTTLAKKVGYLNSRQENNIIVPGKL